ncbi:MAG TPA: ATP-binding protein [Candidatus Cloacimonadota bacterium]|nr:ATP-binding protein [Candidatus Cloacimonadota bacterium]HOQ80460.1 ATP-binding protein [Candidatus Cloacimonadota bacterium]
MKQLLILSGKGGTGKTTVASAFIELANAKAFADCDVDAPNLHLLMSQDTKSVKKDFYGMDKANIDQDKCSSCGICFEHCRFDAILQEEGRFIVDDFACEGCALCYEICPEKAITMVPCVIGDLEFYKDDKVFSSAKLRMGNGNSGLLVSEVKKQMKENKIDQTKLAIIDGSPGIGCPVIASLSGVDLVLIVTEPSLSGMSDLKRIVQTSKKLQAKPVICINKYDTNEEITERIKVYCQEEELAFVGLIPYDMHVIQAVNQGKNIVEIDCKASAAIKEVFENTIKHIF